MATICVAYRRKCDRSWLPSSPIDDSAGRQGRAWKHRRIMHHRRRIEDKADAEIGDGGVKATGACIFVCRVELLMLPHQEGSG